MYAPLSEPHDVSNLHKVWLQCVYFCLIQAIRSYKKQCKCFHKQQYGYMKLHI